MIYNISIKQYLGGTYMRDIKFKFWDTKEKTWMVDGRSETNIYDFAFKKGMNWNFINKQEALERVIILQYTGLKDKNGIEIYEGDILSRKDWGMGGGHDPEERYEVGLIDDYIYEEEQSWHFKTHLWGEWCEVIGNVHDNPELLKETK